MAIGCSTPGPECSPVSCKGVATELEVNRHCLFDSFEQAKGAIETGRKPARLAVNAAVITTMVAETEGFEPSIGLYNPITV